jgi:hypothetical protein
MLKDSPFGDARALLVTFSEVSAHRSGGDFDGNRSVTHIGTGAYQMAPPVIAVVSVQ